MQSCCQFVAEARPEHVHDVRVQVCRGTAVMMVSPTAGTEELAQNPFAAEAE